MGIFKKDGRSIKLGRKPTKNISDADVNQLSNEEFVDTTKAISMPVVEEQINDLKEDLQDSKIKEEIKIGIKKSLDIARKILKKEVR